MPVVEIPLFAVSLSWCMTEPSSFRARGTMLCQILQRILSCHMEAAVGLLTGRDSVGSLFLV
jgi:hypothetical protein